MQQNITHKPQYKIRYVVSHATTSPLMVTATKFADIVQKESAGRVAVEIFPNGQFGGKQMRELEIARGISAGIIEMGQATTSPLTNFYYKLGVFDLPFLFRDSNHWDKVVDSSIGERLLEGLSKHNVRGLAYNDNGQRIIPTINLELHRPEDLRGVKLRILESQVMSAVYKAWGAIPVPIPVRKIVDMAKTGFIQGADRSYPTYWDYGQQEVFKVVNETYHAILPSVVLVSEPFYQSLPEEIKKILINAVKIAARLERLQFRSHVDVVKKLCIQHSIKVVKLSLPERKAFQSASEKVYKEYGPIFGEDIVQDIKDMK